MTIAAILKNKGAGVLTARVEQRMSDVLQILAEHRVGALPVLDGTSVVGVISERDIIAGIAKDGAAFLDKLVRNAMSAPAITVTREHSTLQALVLITHRRIRHLPVVERDELIGIVSIGDLVKRRIDDIENEANALRDYIRGI